MLKSLLDLSMAFSLEGSLGLGASLVHNFLSTTRNAMSELECGSVSALLVVDALGDQLGGTLLVFEALSGDSLPKGLALADDVERTSDESLLPLGHLAESPLGDTSDGPTSRSLSSKHEGSPGSSGSSSVSHESGADGVHFPRNLHSLVSKEAGFSSEEPD